MNSIFTIGIFLSFFLAILLTVKKNKQLPDIILAIWLVIIAVHLTSYYLYSIDYWSRYPHLIGTTLPLPLLHGPMLFLYTLYSLRGDKKLRDVDYLHFLPAILTWLYMSQFYFFYTAEEKIAVDNQWVDDFALFSVLILIAFIVSGILYPILAYLWLGKYKQLINDNFSFKSDINLNWLQYFIFGTGLLYILAAVIYTLQGIAGMKFPFDADYIIYIFIVFCIVNIGYFGIRHQNIFSNNEPQALVRPADKREYKRSGLKSETAEKIHKDLLGLMQDEKAFTDARLTLKNLADRLNISTNHLSQVINQVENVNFYDFVNKFRIEQFIESAKSDSSLNILAHALDAGFNSKSSFNTVFKKHKGTTPSAYIRKLKS